jgi:hypothetical protein
MVFFVIEGMLALVVLFTINITITSGKLKLYEYIIRTICSVVMMGSFMFSYSPNSEPSAAVFLLVSGLLIIPQFLVTDFVQFLRNKKDITALERIVNKTAINVIGIILLLIAVIYCYYAFPVITVH